MNIWGIVRADAILLLPQYAAGDLKQPNLTLRGNVAVEAVLTSAGGLVPSAAALDNGAVVAGQTIAIGIAEQYVFSQVGGNWVRAIALADADATPSAATNTLAVITHAQVFNGATWDLLRAVPDNADGQAPLGLGTQGVVARLQGWNGATWDRIGAQGDNADGIPVVTRGIIKASTRPELFNETSYDRHRGNTDFIVLASAVRNATTTSADFINYNGRGGFFFLNVTAAPGIQTVTLSLQYKDPASGAYALALSGTAQSGTGIQVLIAANPAAGNPLLSRTFNLVVTHSGAGNFTYSVGGSITA